MTWHNLFGHQSTWSAISSPIDQDALGQPWVDQKSKLGQKNFKTIFLMFLHQNQATRWFWSTLTMFDKVWPKIDPQGHQNGLELAPLRRLSNSLSNNYSWVEIEVKTVKISRKSRKVHQHASWGHKFWSKCWILNFLSVLKTRHPKLSRNTKISLIWV